MHRPRVREAVNALLLHRPPLLPDRRRPVSLSCCSQCRHIPAGAPHPDQRYRNRSPTRHLHRIRSQRSYSCRLHTAQYCRPHCPCLSGYLCTPKSSFPCHSPAWTAGSLLSLPYKLCKFCCSRSALSPLPSQFPGAPQPV